MSLYSDRFDANDSVIVETTDNDNHHLKEASVGLLN